MRAFAIALTAALLTAALLPAAAAAHGPIAPVASSYLAKVATVPPGIDAKVIDGDQRMWFSVAPHLTVIVVDYRGAPSCGSGARGSRSTGTRRCTTSTRAPPRCRLRA